MTRFEPIDLSGLRSRPVERVEQSQPSPQRPETGNNLLVWAAVLTLAFMWFRSGDGPVPAPGPTPIDADGLRVLIVEPDDSSAITKLQNEFVNSIKVAEWVDSKSGQLRRFRESQDITKQDTVWQQMRQQADATNRVVVVKNRKPYRMPIPEGVEAGIRALEGIR